MAELGKKLGMFLLKSLAAVAICHAVSNKLDGKDILGRPKVKKAEETTKVDWAGNVQLGTADYRIV